MSTLDCVVSFGVGAFLGLVTGGGIVAATLSKKRQITKESSVAPSTTSSHGDSVSKTRALIDYANEHSIRYHPMQDQLVTLTKNHPLAPMMTAPETCQLLQNISIAMNAKLVVQIGAFTGTTTLALALSLAGDGKVIAIESNGPQINIGKRFWETSAMDRKIELVVTPSYLEGVDYLINREMFGMVDLIYIDADKNNYEQYYEKSLRLARRGGIIAIDGVLWYGSVLDEASDQPCATAVKIFNDKLRFDKRIVLSMLNIGDGLTLAVKL